MQGWDLNLFFEVLLCHKIAKAAGINLCRFQLGPSTPQQMDPGSTSIMKSIHAHSICICIYIYIYLNIYMLLRPLHCCTTIFGCPLDHTFWVQLQLGLDGSCHWVVQLAQPAPEHSRWFGRFGLHLGGNYFWRIFKAKGSEPPALFLWGSWVCTKRLPNVPSNLAEPNEAIITSI